MSEFTIITARTIDFRGRTKWIAMIKQENVTRGRSWAWDKESAEANARRLIFTHLGKMK